MPNDKKANLDNNTVNVEPIKKEPKKPISKSRLITFIGGGVGIILLVLFAIFALNPTKKVVFNSNGGTKIPTVMIDKETAQITKPEDPTRFGWDFVGWFEKQDLSGNAFNFEKDHFAEYKTGEATGEKIYTDKDSDKEGIQYVLQTTTLHAKWKLHDYIVTFYDYDTKEEIVLKDSEDNNIVFSYHVRHNPTDEEVKQYISEHENVSDKEALSILNKILLADSISIMDIISDKLNQSGKQMVFYDENNNVITNLQTETPVDVKVYVQYK